MSFKMSENEVANIDVQRSVDGQASKGKRAAIEVYPGGWKRCKCGFRMIARQCGDC